MADDSLWEGLQQPVPVQRGLWDGLYDPATGMPYPGQAPDYGQLSQRMGGAAQVVAPSPDTIARVGNASRRMTSGEFYGGLAQGLYEAGAMPGRAFGTVPGGPPTPEEEANWGAGTALGMLGAARLPGGAPAGAVGSGGSRLLQPYVHEGEVLPPAPLMGRIGGPHPSGIIQAYHSSPYTFTSFDPARAFTGEGAQSYGHGAAYLAENPAVSGQGGQYWRQFQPRFSGTEGMAAAILSANKFNRDAAIAHAQQLVDEGYARGDHLPPDSRVAGVQRGREDTLKLLQSGNPVGPRTYEVNINARPEQMLDWDKPLSVQPPAAQEIARVAGMHPDEFDITKGGALYRKAGDLFGPRGSSSNFDVAASRGLNEAGIPGIRYLDEGSRRADAGADVNATIIRMLDANGGNVPGALAEFKARAARVTDPNLLARSNIPGVIQQLESGTWRDPRTHNYVIFDPNKLDIRKMYAVPGAVGAGAAATGGMWDSLFPQREEQ